MSAQEPRRGVFVSLQAPGYELAVTEGHRAAGVLLDRDLVVFPEMRRSLLYEVVTYDVLLVPTPQPSRLPAERIKPSYIEAHGMEGDETVVAFVRLARPSRQLAGRMPQAPVPEGGLPASVDGSLDLWSVLEGIGSIGPGRRIDPAEVLEHVRITGIVVDSPAIDVHIHSSNDGALKSMCDIFHFPWCPAK